MMRSYPWVATPDITVLLLLFTCLVSPTDYKSRHFWPGQIRAVVFHGPNRHRLSSGLLNNDIVLTTYDTLRSEWTSSSTNSVRFSHSEGWARVILDEGEASISTEHMIRGSLTL
jgi:SNF2 family DNA or RNA helicase